MYQGQERAGRPSACSSGSRLSGASSRSVVRQRPASGGPLAAHIVILGMVVWLFGKADSSTAVACFLLGRGGHPITTRYVGMGPHACTSSSASSHVDGSLGGALSRNSLYVRSSKRSGETHLTGRTEIWGDLFDVDLSPWLGTGFESSGSGNEPTYWQAVHLPSKPGPQRLHRDVCQPRLGRPRVPRSAHGAGVQTNYVDAYRENAGLGP